MLQDHETWKVILQALAIVVGATFSVFQLRNLTSKSRSTLKTDLEILKLLDPSSQHYQLLQHQIDEEIRRTYIERKSYRRFKVHNWDDFIFGVVAMLIFSAWTLYLLQDGFNWWAILTGMGAFVGLGGIMNGLESKKLPKETHNGDDIA